MLIKFYGTTLLLLSLCGYVQLSLTERSCAAFMRVLKTGDQNCVGIKLRQ